MTVGVTKNKVGEQAAFGMRKEHIRRKTCMSAAKFMVTGPLNNYGKEIVALAKNSEKASREKIFERELDYAFPVSEFADKAVFLRELYESLRFFYQEALVNPGEKDVQRVGEIVYFCMGTSEVMRKTNRFTGSGKNIIDNVFEKEFIEAHGVEKCAEIAPAVLMDEGFFKKYYTVYASPGGIEIMTNTEAVMSSTREEAEAMALHPGSNFRLYSACFYAAIKFGKNIAETVEKESYAAFLCSLRYGAFESIELGDDAANAILPKEIRKAKSMYDLGKVSSWGDEVVFTMLAATGVEIPFQRLIKSDAKSIISILGGIMKSYMEENDILDNAKEEACDLISDYGVMAFVLWSLASEYKKALSLIKAEVKGCVPALVKEKKDPVDTEKELEMKELSTRIAELEKQLSECASVSLSRKEKIGKLEQRLKESENDNLWALEEMEKTRADAEMLAESIVEHCAYVHDEAVEKLLHCYGALEEVDSSASKDAKEQAEENEGGDIDYRKLLDELTAGKRVIFTGCTKPMEKRFGDIHPHIRCIYGHKARSTLEQTFKNAEVIFMHTNSISHKQYYKITSVNKNVFYINRFNNLEMLEKGMCEALLKQKGVRASDS